MLCRSVRGVVLRNGTKGVKEIIRTATTASSSVTESSSSSGTTNPAPGAPGGPGSPFTVFDRQAKLLQKSRAAKKNNGQSSRDTDYIRDAVTINLCERLYDIKRNFPTIVDLGSGAGNLVRHLDSKQTGTSRIIMCDTSESALHRDKHIDSRYDGQ